MIKYVINNNQLKEKLYASNLDANLTMALPCLNQVYKINVFNLKHEDYYASLL